MKLPPQPILDAALLTLHRALIYTRNVTLHPDPSTSKQVNAIMEAFHEIPDFLAHWDNHNLDELRLHLRYFDQTRWIGAPDFAQVFEARLIELTKWSQAVRPFLTSNRPAPCALTPSSPYSGYKAPAVA